MPKKPRGSVPAVTSAPPAATSAVAKAAEAVRSARRHASRSSVPTNASTTTMEMTAAASDGTWARSGCTPTSGTPLIFGTNASPNDGRSHHGGRDTIAATIRVPKDQPTVCFAAPIVLTRLLRLPSLPCSASSISGGAQSTRNTTADTNDVRRTFPRSSGQPSGSRRRRCHIVHASAPVPQIASTGTSTA